MRAALLHGSLVVSVLLGAMAVSYQRGYVATPTSAALSPTPLDLDEYGGLRQAPVPSGATGIFRVEKVGKRWIFVTPAGNALWMLGVFNIFLEQRPSDVGKGYYELILAKYGTVEKWGSQIPLRLRSWGFNVAAEYVDLRVWQKMPTIHMVNTAFNCLLNRWDLGPGPVKDLISGTDRAVYTGWRGGTTPDVFDPGFEAYVEQTMARDLSGFKRFYGSPWFVGLATDDRDWLFGFGPGVEIPARSPHPHLGWIVLVGNPQQTANAAKGVAYADTTVYSKRALRDMLKAKYGTIQVLNAAWGSKYGHWDSAGGSGLLDESGRSPWVGKDFVSLKDASPVVRTDLDAYLYLYAKRDFSVMARAIRRHAGPRHLVFGPATLNSDGLTRKEILRAAGEEMDVVQASIQSQAALELTTRYTGGRPLVTWEGFVANPDSALFRYPQASGSLAVPTQKMRGRLYADWVSTRFQSTTTSGTKPIAGIKYWEFHDNWREKGNWGLVTLSDNAYDGNEARRAAGKDAWGYATGGEERDYGDYLSAVRSTNLAVQQALIEELRQLQRKQ